MPANSTPIDDIITSEVGAEDPNIQQKPPDESSTLGWEGWSRAEPESSDVSNKRRRSLSRSSDEDHDSGRGGQRSIRRRGRTPSPQAAHKHQRAGAKRTWNGGNRGDQSGEPSYHNVGSSRYDAHKVPFPAARQQIPILGSSVGAIAGNESEEYNPEDPAVPELQQRQLRGLIPGIGISPLPPPPGPPPGQLHLQHTHGFPQGLQNNIGGGVFAGHMMMQGGQRHPQAGMKSAAEIQMMLRSQLQAQMMQRSQMQMSNGLGGVNPGGMGGGMRGMPMGAMGSGSASHGMGRPNGMGGGGGLGHMNGNGVGGLMMAARGGGMGMGFGHMGGMLPMGHMMQRGGVLGMEPPGRLDGRGLMGMGMGGHGGHGSNGPGHNGHSIGAHGQGPLRGAGDQWERAMGGPGGPVGRPGDMNRGGGVPANEMWDRDAGDGRSQDMQEGYRGEGEGRGEARGEGRGDIRRVEAAAQWKAVSDTVNVTNVPEDKCNEQEVIIFCG